MFMPLSVQTRRTAFLAAILFASLLTRLALGLIHPSLTLEQTALVGITTMLLVAPTLHGWFFEGPFVAPARRWHYVAIAAASVGLFLYFIALRA